MTKRPHPDRESASGHALEVRSRPSESLRVIPEAPKRLVAVPTQETADSASGVVVVDRKARFSERRHSADGASSTLLREQRLIVDIPVPSVLSLAVSGAVSLVVDSGVLPALLWAQSPIACTAGHLRPGPACPVSDAQRRTFAVHRASAGPRLDVYVLDANLPLRDEACSPSPAVVATAQPPCQDRLCAVRFVACLHARSINAPLQRIH